MEDCSYLELQSMAREYKKRRMSLQQDKMATATPIEVSGYWSKHLSSSGRFYFYNRKTEVSQWHQPHDWHPVSPESFKKTPTMESIIDNDTTHNESKLYTHCINNHSVEEKRRDLQLVDSHIENIKYDDDGSKLKQGQRESSQKDYKTADRLMKNSLDLQKRVSNASNDKNYHKQNDNRSSCRELKSSKLLSPSDSYTVVVKLFLNISTSFKLIASLEEGPPFEKESSYMLDSLTRLTDLVPTLDQTQYNAIFKEYLNLIEEAVQVIMTKLLPAECLEYHDDQLQNLLTRLISVINENNCNADDDDDDDDGEIVSSEEDDNDNSKNNCINTDDRLDVGHIENSRTMDTNNQRPSPLDDSDFTDRRQIINTGGGNVNYSQSREVMIDAEGNAVSVSNKRPKIDSKSGDSNYGNVENINLDPVIYRKNCIEDGVKSAYDEPSILSTNNNEHSIADDDEGLCDGGDTEDDTILPTQQMKEKLEDSILVNIVYTTPQPPIFLRNPFAILSEFQHLFHVRLTEHINSWRSIEKQADQCSRECSHLLNVPYRTAISALKKARSDLRVEDTIYQLQLHKKQHLENQIRDLNSKTL